MKVKDLIRELSMHPENAELEISVWDDRLGDYISWDMNKLCVSGFLGITTDGTIGTVVNIDLD